MSDRVEVFERRRNGLPTSRGTSGPLGRRLLLNPWTWVFLVLTLVYAACLRFQYVMITAPVSGQGGETPGLNWSAVRDAAGLAFPTLAFWVVVYVLLDRFRPQRPLFWWLALGWGGAVATAASIVINTWAAQEMQIAGADPSQGARAAVFVAPFVEEATKASVLFGIGVAHRYGLVSRVSGIVLAGLSAAGFAFTENVIYYARAIVYASTNIATGDPEQAIAKLVWMRGVWLAFGHPLFTTMTGIGVLVAIRTHSKVVRVFAPLAGYLCAALLHMAFNTAASLLQTETQQYLVYFALVLPLVLGVAVWIARQLFVEGRRLRDRLTDFVRMGWLTEGDALAFSRERLRIWAVLVASTRGLRCLVATLRLQRAVTELAYLRDAQVRGIVDAAGDRRARELLRRIPTLQPVAIADPRGLRLNLPDVRALVRRIPLPPLGRRARPPQLPTQPHATTFSGSVGSSPTYSPVDPRWGPPNL